jgi:hypothetical protein|nr:MAG: hypothetical protein [Bacteriophage sp.]
MEKARIIIYDDWAILDETETFFKDKSYLIGIAKSTLQQTPDAVIAEVWVNDRLKMKFRINSKGKVQQCKVSQHPGWGGRRERAGAPSKGAAALIYRVVTHVNEETFEFCESLGRNKGAWLRQAIAEKREREDKEKAGH